MLLPEARRGLVREARPPCRHRRKGRQRRTLSVRREWRRAGPVRADGDDRVPRLGVVGGDRSEEHTSELQSLMRISYAVFCLKKKTMHKTAHIYTPEHTSHHIKRIRI